MLLIPQCQCQFSPACAPGMAVYRGTCGNLTLIDCFNADAGFMGISNGEIRWEVLNVTPGETIYVRLWEKTNNETSIFFAASVITSLPEADCNNPPELGTTGCNILAPSGTIKLLMIVVGHLLIMLFLFI